jgi:drug/metabolite transporter (DMT)-like permease
VFIIRSNDTSKAYLFLSITTAAWGSLYVVNKYLMTYVPPLTVLMCRYLIAAAVLLPLLKLRASRSVTRQRIERKDYRYIVLIGAFGYFGSVAAQTIGTQLASAGLASLLNSLNPLFMIVFAIPLLKERITFSKVVSIVAALVGVCIILGGNVSGDIVAGGVASLLSVVVWSFTSVSLRRFTKRYDPLTITTYATMVALVCTIPFSANELLTTPGVELFRPDVLLGLLYVGVICTALTNVLWNTSLSLIEAGRCALFYPIQPLVATLLGTLFLNETLQMSFLVGSTLIIGGVVFSVCSPALKSKETSSVREKVSALRR